MRPVPIAPATQAPRTTTCGASTGPATSTRQPMTGSAIRASTFHSPVSMSEVEIARLPKPQERNISTSSASPTPAPSGSTLAARELTALAISPCRCLSPGSEPLSTQV